MPRVALAVGVGLILGGPALVRADSAKQRAADQAFAEGRALAAKQQWKAACEKFEQANALDPLAAGTKLNLGLCYEELGRYHTALAWYREAATRAAETNLPDHEQAAKDHMVALVAKVPAVTIELAAPAPANATVTVDGEAVRPRDFGHVELDPGHHVLVAKAPGKKLARQELELGERDHKTISITMVDGSSDVTLDPGKSRRWIAYGLVVATAGLWSYTLSYGIHKRSEYECYLLDDVGKCPMDLRGTWQAADDAGGRPARLAAANRDVHQLDVWGGTLFAAGALALGGAAVLYVTAPERRTVEATASIAPIVTPDQVGFALTSRF